MWLSTAWVYCGVSAARSPVPPSNAARPAAKGRRRNDFFMGKGSVEPAGLRGGEFGRERQVGAGPGYFLLARGAEDVAEKFGDQRFGQRAGLAIEASRGWRPRGRSDQPRGRRGSAVRRHAWRREAPRCR